MAKRINPDRKESCEHGWIYHDRQAAYIGYRRRCDKCGRREVWRETVRLNPIEHPQFGQWDPAMEWMTDYLDFWTNGTQPVMKEEG